MLAAAPAAASPGGDDGVGFTVDVPDGWTYNATLAQATVQDFSSDEDHPVGAKLKTGGAAYADRDAGVALYLLWFVTDGPVPDAPAAARVELAALATRPTTLAGADATITRIGGGDEAIAGGLAASVEYSQGSTSTHTIARRVLFVDAKGVLHEVDAECVLRDDATKETEEACRRTVASVAITLPAVQLGSLSSPGPATPAAATPSTSGSTPAPSGSTPATPDVAPPTRADAPTAATPSPGGVLVSNPPAPKPASGRYIMWAGAALIALSLVIMSSRRSRRPRSTR